MLVGSVHRLQPSAAPPLGAAAGAFLAQVPNPNTARAYGIALRALAAELGERAPLAELEGEAGADHLATWFAARWGGAAAATFNARLDALSSACTWWVAQG
ncbi:hypothetical protein [Microbispora triticiradicis]|uniref:hypothetical protein n=1 Tax=Microbispora TaxID=2005 RepID=UPI001ABF1933|nr:MULTISPECIES: hypothetical protein [Microbispora]